MGGQITAINLMDEFNACGFNNYLVTLDTAISKAPQTIGSFSNLGTQLYTGRDQQDTSAYIAVNKLRDNWSAKNYNLLAQNYQLLVSQTLKFEAPDVFEDISFTS